MSAWEAPGASDEWFTPKYIFDALGVWFDMDVAAPAGGPRHVPTAQWLTKEDHGGAWDGFIWMNPPFGGRNGIAPWLNRFAAHGNGIALAPDRTSASWFQRAVRAADSVLFLSPKVRFERPDGSAGMSPSTGTALMAIGGEGRRALRNGRSLGWLIENSPH
jgi:hypothetical protein